MPPKRILSDSSISPNAYDNKSKKQFFVSPNRFSVLATDDSTDSALEMPVSNSSNNPEKPTIIEHAVEPEPPPLYIKNINNFSAFIKELARITNPNAFTCRSTSHYLIVRPSDRISYNTIIEHLMDTNASFHTFLPRQLRTYRIVIKNLHHTTLCTDISAALLDKGHSAKHVMNIKNKNKCALPMFFVDLFPQNNNKDVLNITSLLNTIVVIEKPHKTRRGPPQCHQCQIYGHTRNQCHHTPRCVKCSEDHFSEDCTKDQNSPAKCALCAGDHTANYKGCPVFNSLSKRLKNYQNKKRTQTLKINKLVELSALPNTSTTSQSKPSYASVVSKSNDINATINNNRLDSFNDLSTLSNFLSELSSLINPLLSLLTAVLHKLNTP